MAISPSDFPKLIQFVKQNEVGLTIVGPEAPLAAGIVDAFEEAGLKIFGPKKNAAELEGSKVFCKELLRNADVPSAEYQVFYSPDEAVKFLKEREDAPVVVKADGLAAGKGVVVCAHRQEALAAVEQIARQKIFGAAGDRLVIEERLDGQEASVLCYYRRADARYAAAGARSQAGLRRRHRPEHRRDGGVLSRAAGECGNAALGRGARAGSHRPCHEAARWPFRGVLYAGLMITKQGPKVLEYNVRFGDPECQPLLVRLKTDLLDIVEATAEGRLDEIGPLEWDPRPAVCVVMASQGYPGNYGKGFPIRGLGDAERLPDVKVFHAGTAMKDDRVVTAGGRVLNVTALGDTIAQAKLNAYRAVKCIRWAGAWCRKDISDKALG